MVVKIAVLGAGVIGLSTAINVQHTVPGARVTVIADKLYEQTTSYGSGGMFIPSIGSLPDVPVEDLRKWSSSSWQFYKEVALSQEAGTAGTMIMSGYHLRNADFPSGDPLYREFVFSCVKITPDEMKTLGFQNFRHGHKVTTIIIHMRKYLAWLQRKFEQNGGVLVQRYIRNLQEVAGDYDLLMNCSGTGSKDLFGDTKVYPVRGHIVRVKAPWIKQWILTDDERYIIPGKTLVALGTLRQKNHDSLMVDPRETKAIIQKCERLFPSVKGAEVDHEWIGLRPGREGGVRLETEIVKVGQQHLPVVHNYGHESHGIGLSWGTSVYAAQLASQLLSSKTFSKL